MPAEVAEALFDGSDHLPVTMKIFVDAHLGVEDDNLPDLQATVAPNPASETATLRFYNPSEGEIQCELYSLQGQLMVSETRWFSAGYQQLDIPLQAVGKGFYLLRVSNSNGFQQTLKVVKD